MSDVSVMLTTYRRPHTYEQQLTAVRAQSVTPAAIWVWHNVHDGTSPPAASVDRVIRCEPNLGVWPRFHACLSFETEYVCVFDDDTIPGERWLANCLHEMGHREGLYGTNGVIFSGGHRETRRYPGWKKPGSLTRRVDIVGHAWFFKREWLNAYAGTPRPREYQTCGEDYHFSFVMQQLGLFTYVPPHPADDKELWGSTQGGLGRDSHALWSRKGEEQKKADVHQAYLDLGWKLLEG